VLQKIFRNKNISNKLKVRLKNTIIDKTLAYASETWILTQTDRRKINVCEKKMYRRSVGPVYDKEKEIGEYEPINKFIQWYNTPLTTSLVNK
jgi:hypothetical protein